MVVGLGRAGENGFRGGGGNVVVVGLGRIGGGSGLGKGVHLGGWGLLGWDEVGNRPVRRKVESVLCPFRRWEGPEALVVFLSKEAVVPALVGFVCLRASSASMIWSWEAAVVNPPG